VENAVAKQEFYSMFRSGFSERRKTGTLK
jgi:hypothetical protein